MEPRNFKFTVSYDGTAYVGWQFQTSGLAVQQVLETAIARVLGVRARVTGAGRTDSGVHALGQVAGFLAVTDLPAERIMRALNGILPEDIRVLALEDAPATFHAIRDSRWKLYRYCLNDSTIPDIFRRAYSWHLRWKLDVPSMQAAGLTLVGEHDFASFQAANSPRLTSIRTIHRLVVERVPGDSEQIQIEVTADGFLYNMVRNIVGTLVLVGRGERRPEWVAEVLAARCRKRAASTAPPHGLFLVEVGFGDLPAEYQMN